MDTHEPVPMTRRRYRSLVAAAEDAARTAAASAAGPPPSAGSPDVAPVLVVRPRRGRVAAVPSPRTRRRASIRRSLQPVAS